MSTILGDVIEVLEADERLALIHRISHQPPTAYRWSERGCRWVHPLRPTPLWWMPPAIAAIKQTVYLLSSPLLSFYFSRHRVRFNLLCRVPMVSRGRPIPSELKAFPAFERHSPSKFERGPLASASWDKLIEGPLLGRLMSRLWASRRSMVEMMDIPFHVMLSP